MLICILNTQQFAHSSSTKQNVKSNFHFVKRKLNKKLFDCKWCCNKRENSKMQLEMKIESRALKVLFSLRI